MNRVNISDGDEVDLFDITMLLWRQRLLILACTVVFAVGGWGYTTLATPTFLIKVGLHVNLYSVGDAQLCETNIVCLQRQPVALLLSKLEGKWRTNNKNNVLTTKGSGEYNLVEYKAALGKANEEVTATLLLDARNEITTLKGEISPELLDTEHVAMRFMNARKIIKAIEDQGVKVMSFSPFSVVKSPNRLRSMLFFTALGAFFGVVIALFKGEKRRRQESWMEK